MAEPIVMFDIPSTAKGLAWSPNTWKTRFCLNIKNIPYKTVWVEFPDIDRLCKNLGAKPTSQKPNGGPHYTLPVIYDPNTKAAVSDSLAIARYIDKTYPHARAVLPPEADAFTVMFEEAFWAVFPTQGPFPIIIPAVLDILRPASQAYFRRTREEMMGTKLEELAPPGSRKRAETWEEVKLGMHQVAAWLEAGEDEEEKLFFMGDRVGITYADIRLAAFLMWFKKCFGEDSDQWRDIQAWDGGRWGRFMVAFEHYEKVDEGEELESGSYPEGFV